MGNLPKKSTGKDPKNVAADVKAESKTVESASATTSTIVAVSPPAVTSTGTIPATATTPITSSPFPTAVPVISATTATAPSSAPVPVGVSKPPATVSATVSSGTASTTDTKAPAASVNTPPPAETKEQDKAKSKKKKEEVTAKRKDRKDRLNRSKDKPMKTKKVMEKKEEKKGHIETPVTISSDDKSQHHDTAIVPVATPVINVAPVSATTVPPPPPPRPKSPVNEPPKRLPQIERKQEERPVLISPPPSPVRNLSEPGPPPPLYDTDSVASSEFPEQSDALEDDPLAIEQIHSDFGVLQSFLWNMTFPSASDLSSYIPLPQLPSLFDGNKTNDNVSSEKRWPGPADAPKELEDYLLILDTWLRYSDIFPNECQEFTDCYVIPMLTISLSYQFARSATHDPNLMQYYEMLSIESLLQECEMKYGIEHPLFNLVSNLEDRHMDLFHECLRSIKDHPFEPIQFSNMEIDDSESGSLSDEDITDLREALSWLYEVPTELRQTLTVFISPDLHPKLSFFCHEMLIGFDSPRLPHRFKRLQTLSDLTCKVGYGTEEEYVPEIYVEESAILFTTSGAMERIMEMTSDYFLELPGRVKLVTGPNVELLPFGGVVEELLLIDTPKHELWLRHPLAKVQELSICGASVSYVVKALPRMPYLSKLMVDSNGMEEEAELEVELEREEEADVKLHARPGNTISQIPQENQSLISSICISGDNRVVKFLAEVYGKPTYVPVGPTITECRIYNYKIETEEDVKDLEKLLQQLDWSKLKHFTCHVSGSYPDRHVSTIILPLNVAYDLEVVAIDAWLVSGQGENRKPNDLSNCKMLHSLTLYDVSDFVGVWKQFTGFPTHLRLLGMEGLPRVYVDPAFVTDSLHKTVPNRSWMTTHIVATSSHGAKLVLNAM